MRIISVLPRDRIVALRAQTPPNWAIRACSVSELAKALDDTVGGLVAVDPSAMRIDALDSLSNTLLSSSHVVALYLPGDASSHVVIRALGMRVPCELVSYHAKGQSDILHFHATRCLQDSVTVAVLRTMLPHLDALPPAVASMLVQLFNWSPIPSCVEQLLGDHQLERRTTERRVRDSGLPGLWRILTVARLARCWRPLHLQAKRKELLSLSGFQCERTLTSQCRSLLRCGPRAVVSAKLTNAQFADRLNAALLSFRDPPDLGGTNDGICRIAADVVTLSSGSTQ